MNHVDEIAYVEPADAFAGVAGAPFSLLLDSALPSARLGALFLYCRPAAPKSDRQGPRGDGGWPRLRG